MVTLKDIATRCNVDISTVSKVIHGKTIRVGEETREKILQTASELNYRPNALARSLKTGRAGALVLAVKSTTSYVYPEIITGAQEAAEELGTNLFLAQYSVGAHPAQKIVSMIRDGRFDGLLFDEEPYDGFADELEENKIPFVSLNRVSNSSLNFVALNDETGFRKQANYLADLGHKEIAFVSVKPESYVSRLSRDAFMAALAEKGITVPPENVLSCDFLGLEFEHVAEELVSMRRRPTAVGCASLAIALHLIASLKGHGVKTPEDISVIGYHDIPSMSWSHPAITTIRMPSRLQGYTAVQRLVAALDQPHFEGELVSQEPVVVERQSCRPL